VKPDDAYYFEAAKRQAAQSKCVRSQVGAVLVDRFGTIMGTGHNYVPGFDGPCNEVCPRAKRNPESVQSGQTSYTDPETYCPAVHAEKAAMLSVLRADHIAVHDFHGWRMYITRKPCYRCNPYLNAFGIEMIWEGKGDEQEQCSA
jgi:dCMP deaminase